MEHFSRRLNDGLANGEAENDLETNEKEIDDIDIDALLNRPRSYGYKRTKAFEEAPEFVQRLEAFVEVDAGTSLVFVCQMKGFPRPTVRWYRDDEEITSDHPYYDMDTDPQTGIARLILSEVICQDEGAFKCKAENQEGVASTTGYLSVTGDKTQTLAQQQKPPSPGTSPCVSSAPHLRTILEQQSLEEREAEAQKKLPPSPLQDYIEIVQKTKTWPMAKMGYYPADFLPKHKSLDKEDDSGSDTSIESQPDDEPHITRVTVHTPIKQQQNSKIVISNSYCANNSANNKNGNQIEENGVNSQNTKLLTVLDYADDDSVHSYDSTEDMEEEDYVPPKCTVSVQIRSCDTVSRLTKIRQEHGDRLSLTLSEDNSDRGSLSDLEMEEGGYDDGGGGSRENGNINQGGEEENMTPMVNGECLESVSSNELNGTEILHKDRIVQNGFSPSLSHTEEDIVCVNIGMLNTSKEMMVNEKDHNNEHFRVSENIETSAEKQDRVSELENQQITKLSKISSNSNKKSVTHQKSRDRKTKLKKQKSLVEISVEWLFQKLTGKVGEQLDLPWIYFFAFTVFCACFAAAVRLNPFYMILIVAAFSFLSFRFLLDDNDNENDGITHDYDGCDSETIIVEDQS